MEKFTIERFGAESLRFAGRKAISVESAPLADSALRRRFELSLYRIDGEGFVAQITFLSDVDGEAAVSMAELLDNVTAVENFFFAFEPEEFLERARVDLPASELQQLAGKLYAEFEITVLQIMGCLTEWKESKSDAFKAAEELHSDR